MMLKENIAALHQLLAVLIESNLLRSNLSYLKSNNQKIITDSKRLSINRIVLLLNELGVLELFQEYSVESQAKIISKISGYGTENIRKSLNNVNRSASKWKGNLHKDNEIVTDFINILT